MGVVIRLTYIHGIPDTVGFGAEQADTSYKAQFSADCRQSRQLVCGLVARPSKAAAINRLGGIRLRIPSDEKLGLISKNKLLPCDANDSRSSRT